MNILFLDDDQHRTREFKSRTIGHVVHTCETAQEAMDLLAAHEFELALLDHDLGGKVFCPSDEQSGHVVAKEIAEKYDHIAVIVHSFNPDGAKNMLAVLPGAVHIPFGSDRFWKTLEKTFEINKDEDAYSSLDGMRRSEGDQF